MEFKVVDFWPFPALNTTRTFTYFNPDNSSANVASVFRLDINSGSVLYEDYLNGKWFNTWYLRYDEKYGVAEWRDDNPQTGWKALFGTVKNQTYRPGNEIYWGNVQRIGDKIENSIVIDYGKSANILPPFKGFWSYGWQEVEFTNFHGTYMDCIGQVWNEVLEFQYFQKWNGKTTGAIYRCPKGIGPVEIQWLGINNNEEEITSKPIAAKVTNSVNT